MAFNIPKLARERKSLEKDSPTTQLSLALMGEREVKNIRGREGGIENLGGTNRNVAVFNNPFSVLEGEDDLGKDKTLVMRQWSRGKKKEK